MKYYTYAYLREDGTPYYVGKGTGHRINSKNHSVGIPPKERRLFLKQNITEEEAFRHEIYMISVLPNLRNITTGGEGSSGRFVSEETKQKISRANKGRKRTERQKENMRGAKIITPELRKKYSESNKGKSPWKGRKHSPETIEKMRKTYRERHAK